MLLTLDLLQLLPPRDPGVGGGAYAIFKGRGVSFFECPLVARLMSTEAGRRMVICQFTATHRYIDPRVGEAFLQLRMGMRNRALLEETVEQGHGDGRHTVLLARGAAPAVICCGTRMREHTESLRPMVACLEREACCAHLAADDCLAIGRKPYDEDLACTCDECHVSVTRATVVVSDATPNSGAGVCYRCGVPGHWRSDEACGPEENWATRRRPPLLAWAGQLPTGSSGDHKVGTAPALRPPSVDSFRPAGVSHSGSPVLLGGRS